MSGGALGRVVLQPVFVFFEVGVVWVVLLLEQLPVVRPVLVHEFDDFVGTFFLLLTAFCTVSLQCVRKARCKETSVVQISLTRKYIRYCT